MFEFFAKSARKSSTSALVQAVLDGSRGARFILDKNGASVYVNKRFQDMFSSDDTITLPKFSKNFSDSTTILAHLKSLEERGKRGETESIELHNIGEDGDDQYYLVTVQPVSEFEGYVHWRVDDVTPQRLMDRAVNEEREKLIDFTDNAPVGFFSVDENGRFVFVNATLARWLGQDIETLLNSGHLHTYFETVPDNVHPYDIVSGGGAKQMGEVVMKGPAGKTFIASISQVVVEENTGNVRTRGVVHDLTAEQEIYRALKVSEDRFERFFEEAPLGIAIVNDIDELTVCNPQLTSMLHMDRQAIEGHNLHDFLHEKDRDKVRQLLDQSRKGKMQSPAEVRLSGKDITVDVQMYVRRLEADNGIMLQFIDMTEQKSLEVQFVQSQKMQAIGQLAGGIAHDFNNLLTAMIGFCDLLLLRHKPSDASFSDIMQIKQNANRAANLVRQLLAFSRQQTLRPRTHDITDILSEVTHLLRRLIGTNIELEVQHGQDLGFVKVDVGQMEQVLINLAVNARDAMLDSGAGNGSLCIQTEVMSNDKPFETISDTMPAGHWVMVKVSDTGTGITEENLAHIFEPFFTTKDVGQGTGLGLATVYGIVRQTGGYLDVETELGKGTSFIIYLPRIGMEEVDEEEAVEAAADVGVQDLTGTAKIMLIEDEAAVRTFSSRALINKGYQVVDADGGESALAALEQDGIDSFDLLVTDVMMPDMDGPTIAAKFREKNPNLKIIYISGYTEERLKDHMGDNIWFLPKPFTLKALAAKVKEALDE